MVRKHPIKCPHCFKLTSYYEEDFMFMVLTVDIKCPHCNKTVILANRPEYNASQKRNPDHYTPPQQININLNFD